VCAVGSRRPTASGWCSPVATDAADAFAAEANRDAPDLGRLAFLLAAVAQPALDVDRELAVLDALALGCAAPTLTSWRDHVWGKLGFRGDSEHYDDPRNSFLNEVIARRAGIPISLAVVGIEIGRRVDVALTPIGMPGHFLLRHDASGTYIDPFTGELLDEGGCQSLHARVTGAPWDADHLAPSSPAAVAARMLANLRNSYRARGDERSLEWVLDLRTRLPRASAADLAALVRLRARWN
jgi:regulator of sirC expression with transglutaminase-like and TPR domain